MYDAKRPLCLIALLLAATLAGCLGGADEGAEATPGSAEAVAPDAAPSDDNGGDDAAPAGGLVVEAPDWEVGRWFGYHAFFGPEDAEGIHYDSVVVAEDASAWRLAAADRFLSKLDAAFDLSFLGDFSKEDLSTTAGGEPWTWYAFPLHDGATWTARFPVEANGELTTYDVTLEATYNPAIPVGDTTHPGFDITGRTAEGDLFIEYDYVPAIGWYAHLYAYDPASEEGDWWLHVMTMGHGANWTGTAYVDTAERRLGHDSFVAFSTEPTRSVQPNPHGAFEVSEAATHVFGFAYSGAFAGAHDTRVVDPEGEHHAFTAVDATGAFGFASDFLLVDALPGEWHVTTAGAGLVTFGGVHAWETVEHAFTLEDGAVVE